MKITSLQNDFVKHLVKLQQKKYRDQSNQVLLEGLHLRQEVIDAGITFQSLGLADENDIVITEQIAQKISTTQSGSEVFTLIDKPQYSLDLTGSRYLLVDGVQDPGNLGTMIRTAYSFGFDAVIISNTSVDEYNDKCVRSTQGALFHIPCIRGDLSEIILSLKMNGIKTYATHLCDDTLALSQINKDERMAVVMGHEGQGVSSVVISLCDNTVKIETSNFESLNVAIATAIVCYELKK